MDFVFAKWQLKGDSYKLFIRVFSKKRVEYGFVFRLWMWVVLFHACRVVAFFAGRLLFRFHGDPQLKSPCFWHESRTFAAAIKINSTQPVRDGRILCTETDSTQCHPGTTSGPFAKMYYVYRL